jgi:hypothetical protein
MASIEELSDPTLLIMDNVCYLDLIITLNCFYCYYSLFQMLVNFLHNQNDIGVLFHAFWRV